MSQYGFFIDTSRCTGCNACTIACKQWHDINPGPVKWIRVHQWEKGSFPDIDLRVLPLMCAHCQDPLCVDACPNHAITKEGKYGAVLVDPAKCTGERKCWQACPYGVPQFESDEPGTKMSKCTMCIDRLEQGESPICVLSCSLRALEFGPLEELQKKFGDAVNGARPIEKPPAPCHQACPAQLDVQGYVEKIADGQMAEALAVIRKTTPLAGVLGRICTHPCESACFRGRFDDAVSICALKRVAADTERIDADRAPVTPIPITQSQKVAVIGSGPAGLSCAYDLIQNGYGVTVFEAQPKSGGLLRYGIPEYRLPKDILEHEIGIIEKLGVTIQTGTAVHDLESLFNQGYAAVFLAIGAWQSIRLNVPGEDARGVMSGLDFLGKINSGATVDPGKTVIVVGGGNVAIDCARSALRLGASQVHLVCLECSAPNQKDSMLAQEEEIKAAEQEGVVIHASLGVNQILVKDGKVTGLHGMDCLSVRDADGRFAPQMDDSCTPTFLDADTVISAIGQCVDPSMQPDGAKLTTDALTMQTDDPRVFAGGDAVHGPKDAISAIAKGKAAAASIVRLLQGQDLRAGRTAPFESDPRHLEKKSLQPAALAVQDRKGFAEVNMAFDAATAKEQAQRCLKCATLTPSLVIRREMPKKQVVPWNAQEALALWQQRHPEEGPDLPPVYTDVDDVVRPPEPGLIGRDRLVLKPKNVEEALRYTTDDE